MRGMKFGLSLAASFAATLAGCGSDSRTPTPPRELQPLCPGCVKSIGGETSDFGGGEGCARAEQSLTEEIAQAFELHAAIERYERSFERSLRWENEDIDLPDTLLRGSITLGQPKYFRSLSDVCPDRIEAPASVDLETADLAFRTAAQGRLTLFQDDPVGSFSARADLALVLGMLDLRIESARPHVGSLSTLLRAEPSGPRGTVLIEVHYFPDAEAAQTFASGAHGPRPTDGLALLAEFLEE